MSALSLLIYNEYKCILSWDFQRSLKVRHPDSIGFFIEGGWPVSLDITEQMYPQCKFRHLNYAAQFLNKNQKPSHFNGGCDYLFSEINGFFAEVIIYEFIYLSL